MALTSAEKSARYRAKDVDAYREKKRALTRLEKHRKKRREYMQKWREENREKHNAWARDYHRRMYPFRKEKIRDLRLKYVYGMAAEDYDRMFLQQDGACKICRTTNTGRWSRFDVDHCHKTGKVRGLLCHRCNSALGWFETNAEMATQYLARTQTR